MGRYEQKNESQTTIALANLKSFRLAIKTDGMQQIYFSSPQKLKSLSFIWKQYFCTECNLDEPKSNKSIKEVLVQKNQSSKWHAEQFGKNDVKISRWCTNQVEPTLNSLGSIEELLGVQIADFINNEQK